MKKLFILPFFLVIAISSWSQAPSWEVIPQEFSSSMVVVGVINLNAEESVDDSDMVGAFINGELRGVTSPVFDENTGRSMAYMIIYGELNGEQVEFDIYDSSADQIIRAATTVPFEVNGIVGTAYNPHIWSDRILTAAEDVFRVEVSLYPNPVIDQLTVSIDDPTRGELELTILDVQGNEVIKKRMSKKTNSFETMIQTSTVVKGVYLLQVTQNGVPKYSSRFIRY